MHTLHRYIAQLFLMSAVFFCAAVPIAQAEVIRSFDTDIALRADSSFSVTETIAYDFEAALRHGIFRTIPTRHPQDASVWYKDRYIDIELHDVLMDGAPVPYEINTSGGELEIKIGDADREISGLHTYTITYDVRGALFYEADTAELYWNATGDEWEVPVEEVTVALSAPEGMLAAAHTCYAGVRGSTERCSGITAESGVLFTASALRPGEGVTIAQKLNAGTVEEVILERTSSPVLLWLALAGAAALLISLIVFIYRTTTKHKPQVPIIAQYEPYADVRPMYAGVLIDGSLHPSDITAGIVYLAEQGFLTIKKIDKKFLFFDTSDYEITLVRDAATVPGTFLPTVLALLFGDKAQAGTMVSLSDITKDLPQQQLNQKLLQELRSALLADIKEEGFYEDVLKHVWHRRTRKGYEARNHLLGFKKFLSVTEKDRLAFHNAPSKNPETFFAYLPYAIAFGVEKEWAKVFEGVTMPTPSWYVGSHAGAFHAAAFASDMSAFSSSLSSSSGASAASGGGSVGGGAGGGGGGSW